MSAQLSSLLLQRRDVGCRRKTAVGCCSCQSAASAREALGFGFPTVMPVSIGTAGANAATAAASRASSMTNAVTLRAAPAAMPVTGAMKAGQSARPGPGDAIGGAPGNRRTPMYRMGPSENGVQRPIVKGM